MRDDTKNGCVADYVLPCIFLTYTKNPEKSNDLFVYCTNLTYRCIYRGESIEGLSEPWFLFLSSFCILYFGFSHTCMSWTFRKRKRFKIHHTFKFSFSEAIVCLQLGLLVINFSIFRHNCCFCSLILHICYLLGDAYNLM